MLPFREVFFNIDRHLLFYALAALATAVCVWGLFRRWRLWRSGWPEKRERGLDAALLLRRVLLNSSILRGDALAGITHLLILWGFLVLFAGTVLSTLDHWGLPFLRGDLYLAYAFGLDLAGVALIAGVALAYVRRYSTERGRMQTGARDHVALLLLLVIAVTGFLVEGLRMDAAPPPWREPSPVGAWIAGLSTLSAADALGWHRLAWWTHAGASLALVAWLPFSKLVHVFAASVNVALEGMRSTSFLTLEEREALQADFSFRHHVMCDACTQCDRCTSVCPSATAKEPLSPRRVVEEAGRFVRRKAGFGVLPRPAEPTLAKGAAIGGDSPWYCTTCGACAAECPSAISPMDLLREVRAARLESGEDVPANLQEMLESVYKFKNPWQGAKGKRLDWAAGLDVPLLSDGGGEPRCFYVGCTLAYDARLQSVPRAAVSLFRAAGFGFGVLGKEEVCCSELVRGVGEDGLFTELACMNADAFERHGVREIVTPCPHGLHTFTSHYARLEPSMKERRVLHVSQALEAILASGALALVDRGEVRVTFHDPCFLGRRTGVYDAPRNVLRSVPGVELVEMPRSRERSLCCGGGGGRMWMEGGEGEKIAEIRIREAAGTGAAIVVTACPFCFTNLDDAARTAGLEDRITVQDLTELVADHLPAANAN